MHTVSQAGPTAGCNWQCSGSSVWGSLGPNLMEWGGIQSPQDKQQNRPAKASFPYNLAHLFKTIKEKVLAEPRQQRSGGK